MNAKRFLVLFFPLLLSVVGVAKSQLATSFAPQKGISENVVTNSSNIPQEAKMIPMLAIGNKWNTLKLCDVFDGDKMLGTDKTTYHYTIEREVDIKGKKYIEVLRDGEPLCFMREDLRQGKVYIANSKGEEDIYFDYTLKEEEVCTLRKMSTQYGNVVYQMKVISITHKEINGAMRRVYQLAFAHLDDYEVPIEDQDPFKYINPPQGDPFQTHDLYNLDTGFFIEGIGYNQGIYVTLPSSLTGGNCTCEELLCFSDTTKETFERFSDIGCEVNYKVPRSVATPLLDKAKIYYRQGQLSLSLEDGKPHQLSIYDMSAQLIARKASFVGSVTVALPSAVKPNTILIRLDDETMLYTFNFQA